jgi:outer membrane protein, heavy metal efflux system
VSDAAFGTGVLLILCHARMPAHPFSIALLLALALLVATHAGRAADTPLTLTEALRRATEQNPHLLAQAYAERSAAALAEQAGFRPNPTLELEAENFAGTGALQGIGALETTVTASQVVERGGKREKRVAAATREQATAAKEFAVRRMDVQATAAVAFVRTVAAQQRLAVAEDPVKLGREMVAAAEARGRAGVGSPAETARARATLAAAQGELARAQSDLVAARARLAACWGGSVQDVPAVVGVLKLPDALDAETGRSESLGEHPRIAWQQAVVESRRAALDLERARATEDIKVGGGVRFLREGSDAALVAGVSLPLPVRHRNQGNIRAARETLAGAEQTTRAIEAELRAELTAAWHAVAAAHTAALTLRRDVLPAAEEAHAIVLRAYQQGQLPMIDVLDAQRELVALRRQQVDAEGDFAMAHVRAEALTDSSFPRTTALLSPP